MRSTRSSLLLGAMLATLFSAPAVAGVIFQSVPDDTLYGAPAAHWCSSCSGSYRGYDRFTLGSAASVDNIDAVISDPETSSMAPNLNVSIWTNVGGLPGVQLYGETFNFGSYARQDIAGGAYATELVSLTLGSAWNLAADTYWLSVWDGVGTNGFPGFVGGGGNYYQEGNQFHQGQSAGFILHDDGSQVPVPGTLALLGLGLIGLAAANRRRAD